MNRSQKEDAKIVLSEWKNYGTLDYVACWYKKAVDYILNTSIRCAYVSTNSICQGEQVANLWKPIFLSGAHIDFAYRSFRWNNETNTKAQVHCVIIGFSVAPNNKSKQLYFAERLQFVDNINFYLVAAPIIFIEGRPTPICDAPKMFIGCCMKDDGNYIMTSEEKNEFLKKEPQTVDFIRPYLMGQDFIDRNPRYCLWLNDADPSELEKCPHILSRIKKVIKFRKDCSSPDTQRYAQKPTYPVSLGYYSQKRKTSALALPVVSSENRHYIPMEIITPDTIVGNTLFLIPDAKAYHFGVLTSSVHMSWTRAVCGRLKSDYRYSSHIVYNNFPWPNPTDEQKLAIEKTAQAILDARALYPDCSLATLYNELTMPIELRKAHKANDKAVMQAYGFKENMSESDIVKELMKMYSALIAKEKEG